jgi:dGTPase
MARMQWQQLLNATRLGNRPSKSEPGRSPFISDHDKIMFSNAFRRLARKTQVHPLVRNDHVHNRMTHSLEVSCVGRSLAIRVAHALLDCNHLPLGIEATDLGDIVQATCLAHDIGNPPFGHTGEEAIRSWFRNTGHHFLSDLTHEQAHDLRNFEGNAQGFRILTTAEYHLYQGGMRMTYATLGAFLKYPWTSSCLPHRAGARHDKFGVFQSELHYFREVAQHVGLLEKGADTYARHPLVYLMEAADDFCYGILDLEDGLEMDILEWDTVYSLLKPVLSAPQCAEFEVESKHASVSRKAALLRGKIIDAYIAAGAEAFIAHEDALLSGVVETDLIALCRDEVRESVVNAKSLARQKIFNTSRKVELEIGAYDVIGILFDTICKAVVHWVKQVPLDYKEARVLQLIGEDTFPPHLRDHPDPHQKVYLALMRVIDYISGMTDNYAMYLAKQFSGFGEPRDW